jgi:hypothetical protein
MNNDYEDQWKIRSRSVLDVSEKTENYGKKKTSLMIIFWI